MGFRMDERSKADIAEILARRVVALRGGSHDEIGRRHHGSITGGLAEQTRMTPLPVIENLVDPELFAQFERAVLTRGNMVPLVFKDNHLAIAIADPFNRIGVAYCTSTLEIAEITVYLTFQHEISKGAIEKSMGGEEVDLSEVETTQIDEGSSKGDFDITNALDDPVEQKVRLVILEAIKGGASRHHWFVEKKDFYYQYRVDGGLGDKIRSHGAEKQD